MIARIDLIQIIRNEIFQIVEKQGFKLKGSNYCVIKKSKVHSEIYLDAQLKNLEMVCYFSHFHLAISKVVAHLDNTFTELNKDKFNQITFVFGGYETALRSRNEGCFGFRYKGVDFPGIYEKSDIDATLNLLIPFLEEEGLPVLKKYEDLFLMDSDINGKDFWTTDGSKDYGMGGYAFSTKRLAIAHFCSNPNFDMLFDYHYEVIQSELKNGDEARIPEWEQAKIRHFYLRDYLKRLPRL